MSSLPIHYSRRGATNTLKVTRGQVVDDATVSLYPQPWTVAGTDDCYVGRVRQDTSHRNGLAMWTVADNIRKGAALNAVQIAEEMIKRNGFPPEVKKMKELGRLITAMVTPFNKEGEVDYDQAKKLALALLKSGSEGLVLAGTTGESPTLLHEEELILFTEVKKASAIKAQSSPIPAVIARRGGVIHEGRRKNRGGCLPAGGPLLQ